MICCTSSKRFLRVSRNSLESTYLYSWQAQTSPLCCGIIHLHSTWIRYAIPILELGEMRKKRLFAPGNPKFPAKYNLSPWVAELSFSLFFVFFPPGLAIWQKDSYIEQSRENSTVLHPSPAIKITTQAELSACREGFYGFKVSASGRCSPRLLGRVGRVKTALGSGRCTGIEKDRGICWILDCVNLIT